MKGSVSLQQHPDQTCEYLFYPPQGFSLRLCWFPSLPFCNLHVIVGSAHVIFELILIIMDIEIKNTVIANGQTVGRIGITQWIITDKTRDLRSLGVCYSVDTNIMERAKWIHCDPDVRCAQHPLCTLFAVLRDQVLASMLVGYIALRPECLCPLWSILQDLASAKPLPSTLPELGVT